MILYKSSSKHLQRKEPSGLIAWELEHPIKVENNLKSYLFDLLYHFLYMQIFINREEEAKRRRKRREIDPKETAAFLSRPVKKPENLNRNLRKSYEKDFFNVPRFEHFKILKEKREGDNDSIASAKYEDEDYLFTERKKINALEPDPPRVLKKQAKAKKQFIKQMQMQAQIHKSNSQLSSSVSKVGKCNKKTTKRPTPKKQTKPQSSSQSSGSSISSVTSSANSDSQSQNPGRSNQSSTEEKKNGKQQKIDKGDLDQKLDSFTKDEAFHQLKVDPQIMKPIQQKSLDISKQSQQQSELSDGPCIQFNAQEIQSPVNISLINNQQSSYQPIEMPQQADLTISLSGQQEYFSLRQQKLKQVQCKIIANKSQSNSQACPSKNIAQTQHDNHQQEKANSSSKPASRLSLNSKVIVQSIYLCSNHSKLQAVIEMKQQWEQFASIFQHAPCCQHYHSNQFSRHASRESENENKQSEECPNVQSPKVQKEQPNINGLEQNLVKKTSFRRKVRVSGDDHIKRWKK